MENNREIIVLQGYYGDGRELVKVITKELHTAKIEYNYLSELVKISINVKSARVVIVDDSIKIKKNDFIFANEVKKIPHKAIRSSETFERLNTERVKSIREQLREKRIIQLLQKRRDRKRGMAVPNKPLLRRHTSPSKTS